jgi:arylformamidase
LQRTVHHERNVPFGDDEFEKLDIYYPNKMVGDHRVLYFMHGGGQREGHPYHYGFIAEPFLEQGLIFVSAGYQLVPKAQYPENVESAIKGFAWVYENIAGRGGDPLAMYVSGHSAGAWISSNMTVRADWQKQAGLPQDVVKGAVLLSGIYELSDMTRQDGSQYPAEVHPVNMVRVAPPPTVIAFGWPYEASRANADNTKYGVTGFAMAEAIKAAGGSVEVLALEDHDHAQVAAAMADPHSQVFKAALAMIQA